MKYVFLFPGQGSQFVGMGQDLYSSSQTAKFLYDSAEEILGFNIRDISFNGPNDLLRQTEYTQPALFIHSVAINEIFTEMHDVCPSAVAGHSLGEFSALVSAGVLNFEDALNVVKVRSQEMAVAGKTFPGSMAAIMGASEDQLSMILNQKGLVVAANLNAPGQIVISGDVQAIQDAVNTAKNIGVRRAIPLKVSGAFHSPLMTPARDHLEKVMNSVTFNDTHIPIYQNFSASPETHGEKIKENLLAQLENPVNWEETIINMVTDGFTHFLELGAGKVLQGLNRRIHKESVTLSMGNLEQISSYGS